MLLVGSKDLFSVNDGVIAETARACCGKVLRPVTVYKVLERQGCIFNVMLRPARGSMRLPQTRI